MINNNETYLNSINVSYAPFVTPEKYAELTGLTEVAVENMVTLGKLPVLRRESGKRGRNFINMKALEIYAEEQAERHEHWKSAI
ncbi:hypothetical protein HC725_02025 [Vibrio sp. S17_S38]|uniref:Cox family DNA-binding protein n=1 Tax=Vibrio sp. S17_S38 TaxID=2720229 RepID=UPI0016814CC3|nr:Cox family DNA-binding protein [Vibrio sp. S17_S38]MBD1572056.1 hypothetical protein [Vibrio sp. S17_S38]